MTKLSVNINKIATLRNARGGNNPDLLEFAKKIQMFGAQGITVHPRPDERHIRYSDVYDLSPIVNTEFNIEGFPNSSFMNLVLAIKPEQVTLVPDPPGVLTSNAGWDAIGHKDLLTKVIATFKDAGIRTSIFIETDHEQIAAAKATGTDRIELYTEAYATGYLHDRDAAVAPFVSSAAFAKSIDLGVNAGHDLSLENLSFFAQKLHGNLDEVSIGHALISDALYLGLHNTIQQYRNCLNPIAWK